MTTVTLLSGQTYIEEEREGKFSLIPAHIWLEDQVAVEEIALLFELLAEKRDTDRFKPFLHWLLVNSARNMATGGQDYLRLT